MKQVSVYKENQNGMEFIAIFNSIAEASKELGIHKSQISRCLNKIQHYNSAHGYKFFEYAEGNTEDRKENPFS